MNTEISYQNGNREVCIINCFLLHFDGRSTSIKYSVTAAKKHNMLNNRPVMCTIDTMLSITGFTGLPAAYIT